MNKKQNMVFLGIGAALLIGAAINFLTPTKEHKHKTDEIELVDPSASTGGASLPTGGAIMGKTMPSNHESLVQIQTLKDMLEKNPNDLEHWVMLGNMYFDIQQFENAIQPYEKALQLKPRDANVRVDYAVSLFNTGKDEQAVRELQAVVKDYPSHQTAFYNLGVILLHSSQKDKAREYWAKAIDIDANSALGQKARQALSNLR